MAEPAIRITDLRFRYPEGEFELCVPELVVARGERVGIVGPRLVDASGRLARSVHAPPSLMSALGASYGDEHGAAQWAKVTEAWT